MKRIEKFVWAAALIGFVAIAYLQINYIQDRLNPILGDLDSKWDKIVFDLYLSTFLSYLDHFICAAWLYFAAKTEAVSKGAWAFFGLAFGVLGIVCFYAASVHFQLKSLKRKASTNRT